MNYSTHALSVSTPGAHNFIIEQFQQACARRTCTLSLTANENILSETARSLGQNRHYERYLFNAQAIDGQRYAAEFNGMHVEHFPEVETLKALATQAVQAMFNAPFVEYRVLSGVHCTLSVLTALTAPGDTIVSLAPESGGHFATGPLVEKIGRHSAFVSLTADGQIDLEQFARLLQTLGTRPAAVLLDHGLTTRAIAIKPLRALLNRHGLERTLIIYDASHTLGLIAGQAFPNPLDDGADILQGNTHKSLAGPHRALIVARRADLAAQIEQTLSAGLISSPNLPGLLQLFVTLVETRHYGQAYAQRMCANTRQLHAALADLPGWTLHPTDTHLLLLEGEQARQAAQQLNELGIRVNNKQVNGRDCLRFGLQEITRLGISSEDLDALAHIIRHVLSGVANGGDRIRLAHICQRLNQIHYSFDQEACQ
jgi:glycine/serine hydroxymethyltransferase